MVRLNHQKLITAFALLLASCQSAHVGSRDASVSSDISTARSDAGTAAAADGGVDCTPVFTGGGLIGRACVHEVPSGSFISLGDGGATFVMLGGKVIATYGPCPCKVLNGNHIGPPVDAGPEGPDSGLPTTDGG